MQTNSPLALLSGALTGLFLGSAPLPLAAQTAESATVSVDFGSTEGALVRTERLNNFGNPTVFPELRAGDVAFFNEQGLRSALHRVWMDDDAEENTGFTQLCDVTTGICDFSQVADYFRDASDIADSLLVDVMARTAMEEGVPPAETKAMLKLIIQGLKQEFPAIEYIEAFNEPDHVYGQSGILQPHELYPYYVPIYEVVNEVNEELDPEVPLKIGGPAFSGFQPTATWMSAFLDGYAADPNPEKRLDFISWHGYGYFDDDWNFHMFKGDPSEVAEQRPRLDDLLLSRGLSPDIPVFITEAGIYPGPSFDDPSGQTDYVRQAAGTASLHYWYTTSFDTFPFHWVVRHGTDGRKDQLVTRTLPEAPCIPFGIPCVPTVQPPPPEDTFTPYGNLMLMQSKMKETRVPAVSDALAGMGIYAVASKDETGASVMVWNYQGIDVTSFEVAVDMDPLPSNLAGELVRQQLFRIDQTTSNFYADPSNPDQADLQMVEESTFTAGTSHSVTLDLEANAVYLILLPEPSRAGQLLAGAVVLVGMAVRRARSTV